MFWLRSRSGTYAKYLIDNETFRVGRKEGEIVIENDQSISRKHAVLTVTDDGVTIEDCKSKYGTYVDNVKLQPSTPTLLKVGSEIKFGTLQSVFMLENLKIAVVTSNLKKVDKRAVVDNVVALNGTVLDTWKADCSILVIKEIMLTPKVLICIIWGIPIVTPKYFTDFLKNVKENRPPPDIENYKPPCGETVLPQKSVNLDYNPKRKTLFANKVFVFSNKAIWNQMTDLIQAAGGKAILFDGSNVTIEAINRSTEEYLFLNDSETFDQNTKLQTILKFVKDQNQRAIPLQEIAVAIVNSSCSKDCNPNFNRVANLVNTPNHNFTCGEALVLSETQSQASEIEIKEDLIVPQSYENTHCPASFEVRDEAGSSKRKGEVLCRTNVQAKVTKMSDGGDVHQKSPPKKLTQPGIASFLQQNKPKSDAGGSSTSSASMEQRSNPFKRKLGATERVNNQNTKTSDAVAATNVVKVERNLFKRPKVEKNLEVKITSDSNIKDNNNVKEKKILSSTLSSQNDTMPSFFSLDMSTIKHEKVGDSEKESHTVGHNSKRSSELWKSKNQDLDPEIQSYIDSFKNCCVIKVKNCLAPERSRISANDTTTSSTSSIGGTKNFKKFRKNPSVCYQTTIIPKSVFEKVTVMA